QTVRELCNTCGKGTLVDVYIAKHKNKLGQMFAFCRFIKVFDQEGLVDSLSNIWINKLRLHANMARFDRKLAVKPSHVGATVHNSRNINLRPVGNSVKVSSYANATKASVGGVNAH
ncbi:RNA-directed DNA polymerase, eukaryota, partial [Tanacetum coccineum]